MNQRNGDKEPEEQKFTNPLTDAKNGRQCCGECAGPPNSTVFIQNNLDKSWDVFHFCSSGCIVRGMRHAFGR